MVNVGLIVRLEAKPGKEAELESFLRDALLLVQAERATTAWFALRLGTTSFGIFDLFPNERARQAHLADVWLQRSARARRNCCRPLP